MPILSSLSLKDEGKTKILSLSDEGALLTDKYGQCGHSPSDVVGLEVQGFVSFRHETLFWAHSISLNTETFRLMGPTIVFILSPCDRSCDFKSRRAKKLRMSGIGVLL